MCRHPLRIVPTLPEGQEIVEALAIAHTDPDPRVLRRLYRRAQLYTVQIPPTVMAALQASGAAVPIVDGDDPPMMLNDLALYRDDLGLDVI